MVEIAFMFDELGNCRYSVDLCYKNIPEDCSDMKPSDCARYIWENYEKSNYVTDRDQRADIADDLSKLFQ